MDEWQLVPAIWNQVKVAVDESAEKGQFIMTGSAVPTEDSTRQPASTRFARVRMQPISLAESGHSSRLVSLTELFGVRSREPSDGRRLGRPAIPGPSGRDLVVEPMDN
jgi:hypothetical protein